MVSSLHAKYFISLTAACAISHACSFVPTSVSLSPAAKPLSSRPYKGTCTLQQSSSPSSSRRRSSSSNVNKKQQTRNRGANQANHNRRGHEFRLNKDSAGRGSGVKKQRARKTNTKRPPRWEREGDNLYQEVSKQYDLQLLAKRRVSTVQDVYDVLEPWMASNSHDDSATYSNDEMQHQRKTEINRSEQSVEPQKDQKTPPFLWGSLPVGPVIASRLRSSNRSSPTSVQTAAFTMLTATQSKNNKKVPTKKTNAIVASPTGTGKTLAYLLPLLCTSPGGQKGEGTGGVLIVTPTIELACQIQREVDILWPPSENGKSSLFVVGANDMDTPFDDEEKKEEDALSQGRFILRSLIGGAPLIAGTPKMLRMLYLEAENIVKRPDDVHPFTNDEREAANALLSNLRAIVLDEADRLLRTEAVARETAERKQRKLDQQRRAEAEDFAYRNNIRPPPPPPKKTKMIVARQTQTELLLRDLPVPSLDDIQIICASATIGRTMRRQLMQILGAPSADAAAALVTGEEDARVKSKDAEKRKSVLLPEKLQHAFKVVDDSDIEVRDEDVDTDNKALTVAERNEERRISATIQGMWNTMVEMEVAKPTIIFPGRVGVERVQEELKALGLKDVRTLRNLNGDSHEADSAEDDVTDASKWKNVPVYIIGERFARGLDINEVGNVILLAPPSSAAGYAHMAGRTGRNDREGTAITLVRPRNSEVQRLAAIAEALGLKFRGDLVAGT